MSGDLCPYCGTLLTSSLKFCVNCRRSVTEDKIKQAGAAKSDEESGKKYKLSRGSSYDSLRAARTFFLTLTSLLTITFVYYFVMKFVIHEPIPFEEEVTHFVDDLQKNFGQSGGQSTPPSPDQGQIPAQQMPDTQQQAPSPTQ